jgi:hypothetical protein
VDPRFTERELDALYERLGHDCRWLDLEGIDMQEWAVEPAENRLVVQVVAADPEAAARMFHAYYGERVRVEVLGTFP